MEQSKDRLIGCVEDMTNVSFEIGESFENQICK
jgi:hypothetical protein